MTRTTIRTGAATAVAAAAVVCLSGSTVVPPGGAPVPADERARTATGVFAAMSLEQRVGQLFMVGTPAMAASAATKSQIGRYHVGSVMLTGRSHRGTAAPSRVAAAMQSRATNSATSRVRLFVSTDQEGGLVQGLHGAGISEIPSALAHGRSTPGRLRASASTWARQLRRAGVNMNLAPVVDTVPSPAAARLNPPIGAYHRQYGYSAARVGRHGRAFCLGMSENGVTPTIKHFPGLGRVRANTDTATRVTDRVTRRGDSYLVPFKTSIDAGAPFVMMSTAYYSRMDGANPAAFSPFIINTVLRGDLGFDGAVISDDLANARQVSRWSYADRAVKFLRAGGSLVLTVDPAALPAMYEAVLHRAERNPTFRAKVDRAALLVLRTKESRNLLGR